MSESSQLIPIQYIFNTACVGSKEVSVCILPSLQETESLLKRLDVKTSRALLYQLYVIRLMQECGNTDCQIDENLGINLEIVI